MFFTVLAIAAFFSCSPPECIQCSGVDGYPEGKICRDTYETTLQTNTPSWKEYSDQGLSSGCTAVE